MLETLTTLFQPWADVYAASSVLPTAIIALHLLAILAGGGIAIGADRHLLRTAPSDPSARRASAEALRETHGVVIAALVGIVASGMALATADLGTFATSLVFWGKMGTFGALLINGTVMRRTEARVLTLADTPGAADDPKAALALAAAWGALRRSAAISLAGWFTVMLLGVLVANG
jgi:hypothetical protein